MVSDTKDLSKFMEAVLPDTKYSKSVNIKTEFEKGDSKELNEKEENFDLRIEQNRLLAKK